jgi:hypothetical protein
MHADPRIARWWAAALCSGLLLAALPAMADVRCRQLLDDGPQPLPGCRLLDGQPVLEASALAGLQHGSDGLAVILADGRFYYQHRNGRLLQVATMDNGPDDFQRGLVRGIVAGRYGFYDRDLAQRIAPQFDGALPFDPDTGRAAVCQGCHAVPAGPDGQHSWLGGRHWHIDVNGQPLP